MKLGTLSRLAMVALFTVAISGCASWDNMSYRQKSAVTGAGLGGVAGAVITGGSVWGTAGGAAIGGLLGDQVGKSK
ncbi:MAG TPA: glycine zipper 2TM domain-containing protein [Paralcaligenes sp.]